jgi:cyclophilin family peptidyl-prolyl cis-trans isomerase
MQGDSAAQEAASWLAAARSGDLFTLKALHASAADAAALCAVRSPGVSSAGHTACHWLSGGGHAACLQWLLSLPGARALSEAVNNGGSTPLHSAAANGHATCLQLLLQAGADPSAPDSCGDTPFACAASRAHEAAARILAAHAPPHAFLHLSVGGRRAGALIFALDEAVAPRACANFLGLCDGFRARQRVPGALYGRDGTLAGASTSIFYGYRGSSFHRLLPGQVLQGGRLAAGDRSIFGESFSDEPSGLAVPQDGRGLLCMANSGADSNACQFYITLAPCPHLTGSHVCFGRLVSGESALSLAENVPSAAHSLAPTESITITSAGRWPPAAPVRAGGGVDLQPVTSLREVGAAAETSRAAVATAVVDALHSRDSSRKRGRVEQPEETETTPIDSSTAQQTKEVRKGAVAPRVAKVWDALSGLDGSTSSGSDSPE